MTQPSPDWLQGKLQRMRLDFYDPPSNEPDAARRHRQRQATRPDLVSTPRIERDPTSDAVKVTVFTRAIGGHTVIPTRDLLEQMNRNRACPTHITRHQLTELIETYFVGRYRVDGRAVVQVSKHARLVEASSRRRRS